MASGAGDRAGLCARCVHAHIVATPRSRFWMCLLSRTDARFSRYPRLPVLSCAGYSPLPEGQEPPSGPPPRESSD